MEIRFERQEGKKAIYSAFIDGRKVFATTVNGEIGARRIFNIIKCGVSRTPPLTQDITTR